MSDRVEVKRLRDTVDAVMRGQESLKAQTVRIRTAAGVTEGDTEDGVRALRAELARVNALVKAWLPYKTGYHIGCDCPLCALAAYADTLP